ncbi:hypothetical protein J6590_070420 [Homalodisca vitripennis]|nr:hypothetical protein J6590_070420 [Homalodisca vitripennis]
MEHVLNACNKHVRLKPNLHVSLTFRDAELDQLTSANPQIVMASGVKTPSRGVQVRTVFLLTCAAKFTAPH